MPINSNDSRSVHRINSNPQQKRGVRNFSFSIDKRQKFVIGTIILSVGLFLSEYQLGRSGILVPIFLSVLTDLFLYWAIYQDLRENRTIEAFILPFFYSLSFGMFYFLSPSSLIFRLLLSAIYAFGVYSVFLSQNILAVSSTRTITLLSGARIVSFVTTLLSYFFLTNIVFTLHTNLLIVVVIVLVYNFFLVYHSLWTYTLQKIDKQLLIWAGTLTVCSIEACMLLWFWPSSPTFVALFLTGFFYAVVGLSHIWFERRLFKGIMWEYVWVGCIIFFVLILFTPWGK
ncbi:MAG TPA: hypothetical protein VLG67_00735 [Candidatus Saccharimonadales bacterium]|nr:hypothetical protein [Candidatus Saccharimonadales bacterium]